MRSKGVERLDDLDASGPEHAQVLEDLVWLNRWLGTPKRAASAVASLGFEAPCIVDLGCASGDLLLALRARFPRADLIGVDGNQAALDRAAKRVEATFMRADILSPDFVLPPCDVVVSTHFLYHFEDRRFREFMLQNPDPAFVIVELKRAALSRFFFEHLLSRFVSEWARSDGLLALDRAFTASEFRALLPGCRVEVGMLELLAVRKSQ